MDIDEGVHKSKGVMRFVKIGLAFSAVLVVSYYFLNPRFPAITDYKASASGFNTPSRSENEELATVLKRAANPNKTVIITCLNDAWAEPNSVFDLQLESFRIGNNTEALIKNLVVVSVDKKAHERCLSLKLNCYFFRLEVKGFNISNAGYYKTPTYMEIVWRRLDFLQTVLSLGYNFFFTDTDILWFRNPYPHLDDNAHIHVACDRYNGKASSVDNWPNTGFMYVKSNVHTILFYKLWYNFRILYPKKLEQEVFNIIKDGALFTSIGLKVRFLDTMHFGGLCEPSRDFSQVCTMHVNCCFGLEHKVNDLKLMLADWRNYSAFSPKQKPPNPFKWSAPNMC